MGVVVLRHPVEAADSGRGGNSLLGGPELVGRRGRDAGEGLVGQGSAEAEGGRDRAVGTGLDAAGDLDPGREWRASRGQVGRVERGRAVVLDRQRSVVPEAVDLRQRGVRELEIDVLGRLTGVLVGDRGRLRLAGQETVELRVRAARDLDLDRALGDRDGAAVVGGEVRTRGGESGQGGGTDSEGGDDGGEALLAAVAHALEHVFLLEL